MNDLIRPMHTEIIDADAMNEIVYGVGDCPVLGGSTREKSCFQTVRVTCSTCARKRGSRRYASLVHARTGARYAIHKAAHSLRHHHERVFLF